MKLCKEGVIFLVCALVLMQVVSVPVAAAPANRDPYATLKLYDGKWDLAASGAEQKITHIENHCSRTGLFFVCEQIVNGKSEALVVFLPLLDSSAGAAQEYRMQALIADASPGGEWSKLTIDGDRWVYSWESTEGGKKISWRNINTFSGPDKIHYEVQRLAPDNSWKTEKSGDERRVKQPSKLAGLAPQWSSVF
jgi:hypothetical protein